MALKNWKKQSKQGMFLLFKWQRTVHTQYPNVKDLIIQYQDSISTYPPTRLKVKHKFKLSKNIVKFKHYEVLGYSYKNYSSIDEQPVLYEIFKTKSQALKFAKSYMRAH
jgi:hypothetical protein